MDNKRVGVLEREKRIGATNDGFDEKRYVGLRQGRVGNKNRIGQVRHNRPITAVPSIKSKTFIVQQSANNTNIVVKDEDDPTQT